MALNDGIESSRAQSASLTEVLVDSNGNLIGPLGIISQVGDDRIRFTPTKPTIVMVTDGYGRMLSRGPAGVANVDVEYILKPGDRVLIWQEGDPLSPFMQLTT